MRNFSRLQTNRFPGRYGAVYLVAVWTIIILLSFAWNVYRSHQANLEKARIEARTFYHLNLAYRSWSALHGGVYVPVTREFPPNPYLNIPNRDVTTREGKELTLVNPAWMTRQVFDLLMKQMPQPVISHITSLKTLNPANGPDTWEESGLRAFERGEQEKSDRIVINGEPYMRVLKPFPTEEGCLKCHGHQGYKVGDIRGGISIAVPLEPFLTAEAGDIRTHSVTHMVFWIIGMGGLLLYTRNVRENQRRIEQSEETYRLLFNNNPHPMWVYDLETLAFLAVNNAAVDHYGYSKDEFLNMSIKDIRPQEDVSDLLKNVSRVSEGIDHAGIWRHRKKDGTIIFVEITSHALNFSGRRAELVMALDLSERKRLEDQLRHSQKMEAVGLLAGGVAHDFNNILTAIIGYSSLMKMKLDEAALHHNMDEIIASAERGAVLTKSLLAFSRKQIIHPRAVNINGIIERVGRLLTRLIREDIKLEIRLAPEELNAVVDTGQVEQVLMNLATNARDSMPEGGTLSIETSCVKIDDHFIKAHNYGKHGDYGLIAMSDSGTGMDSGVANRIFEPFFTTKEMGRGTGLGLSIVYGIVKQHNGYINVYSETGMGTTFKIYFPLTSQAEERHKPGLPDVPGVRGGSEGILVAEDDAHVRLLVKTLLSESGYRVIEAVDGEDALKKFRENRKTTALLLIDVIMPKKNGKEVYDEARKLRPDIKAIFTSGYTADIVHEKGILDEGLHFVSKPVSPSQLLQKIREVLDSP